MTLLFIVLLAVVIGLLIAWMRNGKKTQQGGEKTVEKQAKDQKNDRKSDLCELVASLLDVNIRLRKAGLDSEITAGVESIFDSFRAKLVRIYSDSEYPTLVQALNLVQIKVPNNIMGYVASSPAVREQCTISFQLELAELDREIQGLTNPRLVDESILSDEEVAGFDEQFAAIRTLTSPIPEEERKNFGLDEAQIGSFLDFRGKTFCVKAVNTWKVDDTTSTELTVYCIQTGATCFLEYWEESSVRKAIFSETSYRFSELGLTAGILRDIAEGEDGGHITIGNRNFYFDCDYDATY